ncbi:hypothetical protein [Microtetraspora malaysiensis]|uniref:hypothetical protein n=1 Tax=Microtetraspora malaysiensis TaxID=161358 RepID=UPI003D8DC1C5
MSTADTYTSVLPELHHRAARATARLVLSAARDRPEGAPGAMRLDDPGVTHPCPRP